MELMQIQISQNMHKDLIMSANKSHYLPNGKAYTGPTHKSGGSLMTGAKHTNESVTLSHTMKKPAKK
jgi:hypothetical protein